MGVRACASQRCAHRQRLSKHGCGAVGDAGSTGTCSRHSRSSSTSTCSRREWRPLPRTVGRCKRRAGPSRPQGHLLLPLLLLLQRQRLRRRLALCLPGCRLQTRPRLTKQLSLAGERCPCPGAERPADSCRRSCRCGRTGPRAHVVNRPCRASSAGRQRRCPYRCSCRRSSSRGRARAWAWASRSDSSGSSRSRTAGGDWALCR